MAPRLTFSSFGFLFLFLYTGICFAAPVPAANGAGSSSKSAKGDEQLQGWTSQPNLRGTMDIIWSCGVTIFLCSWSTLCLNLPARGEWRFAIFRRRIYLTGLSFGGPEFIFQIALGQLASARASVKEFKNSGYKGWTLTHAFYADMGGYILRTADEKSFPIDAKQLDYLVMSKYVEFPTTTKEMIKDKNKVDGLLRIITIGQTLWFLVNTAGRAIQHLAITCGELTTVAFIVCSIGTTVSWVHKPADVQT